MGTTQLKGVFKFRLMRPDGVIGQEIQLDADSAGFGGSSGAAPANTIEKWNYLAPSIIAGPGYSLSVVFVPAAAQTLNTTDSYINLPVIVNGQNGTITSWVTAINANFTLDVALAALVTVVGREVELARWTAKPGRSFQIGGNREFIALQY
jgi:hypothetical protein